ncbi:MAG: 5-(carboxyamino)imidazole ribonucleotide synthase [Planctomycetota bacterium]
MSVIRPGATIGVLGAGQLGRMFALAATRMGYRVAVLAKSHEDPAAQIAHDVVLEGDDPVATARALATRSAVVTYEFENIPAGWAHAAADVTPVRPSPRILEIAQDRIAEKSFLAESNIPITAWRAVHDVSSAEASAVELGLPVIQKTATMGYDGLGQRKIARAGEASQHFREVGARPCVQERIVSFDFEISVLVARNQTGECRVYAPFRNEHRDHILDVTTWPAPGLDDATTARAEAIATTIAEAIDLVGLLCVEMFVTATGDVLVNELAPRPHNSGHVTIEAAVTDQFEQQLRAITGLPLGDPSPRSPGAMANLLGQWCLSGVPDLTPILSTSGAHLHLYGKPEARRGRKMGHLTVLDTDPLRAAARARSLRGD